jgi:hypothetical protein
VVGFGLGPALGEARRGSHLGKGFSGTSTGAGNHRS